MLGAGYHFLVRLTCCAGLAAALCLSPLSAIAASECGAAAGTISPVLLGGGASAVTASDALAVLATAIGLFTCDLCVCDVDGSSRITATDALTVLKAAVGQPVTLACPACAATAVSTVGEVRGFLFTAPVMVSSGGGARLLAGTFEIRATSDVPPGQQPVAGAALSIDGGSAGAVTGSDGGFSLSGVLAGERTLRISSGSVEASVKLTVVAAETLVLGSASLSRDEAFQHVIDEVLVFVDNPAPLFIVGSQQPLPAGTVLSTEDPLGRDGFEEVTLTSPAWLFYIDPFVDAAFGHPVQHVLVDDASGIVTVLERSYWPRLNDVDLWSSVEERTIHGPLLEPTEVPGLARGRGAGSLPATVATRPHERVSGYARARVSPRSHDPACNGVTAKTFAILIRGSDESQFLEAATKMEAALSPTASFSVVPLFNASFRDVYRTAVSQANAQLGPCDTLVIYITSHGGWDEQVGEASGNFMYKRTDASLGKDQTEWVTASDLLLPLTGLKACHLVVIADICYGATLINKGTVSFKALVPRLLPKSVQTVVLTSSDSVTSAKYAPINLGNTLFGVETGGRFSNELIASGLLGPPLDLTMLSTSFDASIASVSGSAANRQGATKYVRNPPPGSTCGPARCIVEEEPNDSSSEQTSMNVDPDDSSGCVVGSIDPDAVPVDVDRFGITLPDGDYRVSLTGSDANLTVDTGQEVVSGASPIDFTLAGGGANVSIAVAGPPGDYVLDVAEHGDCAGVRITNSGSQGIILLVVSDDQIINDGSPVVLLPGDTFEEVLPDPLAGLDLIQLDADGPFDLLFDIAVSCGRMEVFDFSDAILSFDNIPLP